MSFGFNHSLIRPLFAPIARQLLTKTKPEVELETPLTDNVRLPRVTVKNTTPPGVDRDLQLQFFLRSGGEEINTGFGFTTLAPGDVATFSSFFFYENGENIVMRTGAATGASWLSAQVMGNYLDCPNVPGAFPRTKLTTQYQAIVPPAAVGQRLSGVFGQGIRNNRSAPVTLSYYIQTNGGFQLQFPDEVIAANDDFFFPSGEVDQVLQPGEAIFAKVDAGVGDVWAFMNYTDVAAPRT